MWWFVAGESFSVIFFRTEWGGHSVDECGRGAEQNKERKLKEAINQTI